MCLNIRIRQLLFMLYFGIFATSIFAQKTQEQGSSALPSQKSTTTSNAELKTPGIGKGDALQFTVIEDDIMKTDGKDKNNEGDGGTNQGKGAVEMMKNIVTDSRNLSERLSRSIQIYPVPARNFVNVEIQDNQVNSISLTNSLGQIVYTENEPMPITKLNISDLPQGVYYILITTKENISTIKSIVKQ